MKIRKYHLSFTVFLAVGWLIVAGCAQIEQIVTVLKTPTPIVTPTLTPPLTSTPSQSPSATWTTAPSATPVIPDTGWKLLRPGLERRQVRLFDDSGRTIELLYLLRLDPARYRFDVAYHQTPQTLEAWQAETGALIVINGGYFRQEAELFIPTGLTVVNGEVIGSSYDAFAGMVAVTDNGTELRWLADKPYDPNEPLQAALQSFPLLVKPGGELGFPEEYEDNRQARRSAIGQDKSGQILLLIATQGYFTLHQFSLYLTRSDLNLEIAINLDGGKSSGLLLANPLEKIPELTLLPIVITVHAR